MIDLATDYLGLSLQSPLVASSSPLTQDLASLKRLEDAGAAAVVLPSLFEEQIVAEEEALDQFLSQGVDSFSEAQSYFPELPSYGMGPKAYLQHVERAKKSLQIPVIASLNGVSPGSWIRYAREIEQAGADALELNVYFLATSPDVGAQQIEERYCALVRDVKGQVRIPVAVKLAPYFTSMANMAHQLDRAGADALVLFNRFYQPDFDLEALEVTPNLTLSDSRELRLRLHWVALLSPQIRPELAITGGVHTAEDVVKAVMAGAKAVMLTSALLRNGVSYIAELAGRLVEWMGEHEYESIRQMRGALNAAAAAQPEMFSRANYMKVLGSYTLRPAETRIR
jgi:dihydroorotate dehydrogenase (fumarate)